MLGYQISMTAYYNEFDPYAAQWLRNLIQAGHIAPGVVDERDIRDIRPDELMGYTQCHFFAGIGVWSYALRRAGWPDDIPIWTGSCPCQPFSAAGRKSGSADERHLWPHLHWLIEQCAPSVVIGEQVASKDGLGWLDLVSSDLEGTGYATAATDLCAAGFDGAHIRQRLYWMAHSANIRQQQYSIFGRSESEAEVDWGMFQSARTRHSLRLANSESYGRSDGKAIKRGCGSVSSATPKILGTGHRLPVGRLAHAECWPTERYGRPLERAEGGMQSETWQQQWVWADTGDVSDRSLTNPPMLGRTPVDWLYCRDGKWRAVEPGTFPLADADPSTVGRLRAYGNALDAETATQFCSAVVDTLGDMAVDDGDLCVT